MEQKRLGDVATYINGYAFKPEDRGSEGLPIIRIQDLTGNAYDVGFYNGNYPERIEIKNGDVLISWSASLGVYIWNRGRALLNQHIFKVVFDKAEVNKQYFVYAVKYNLKEMETKAHGATMKHIIKKDFDNTRIPFPSLEEQAKIANILSKVANIIETRKQELQKLDDLIKARFVETFGHQSHNEKSLPYMTIDDIAEIYLGITHTPTYVDSGVMFISAKNTSGDFLDLSDVKYISREEFEGAPKGSKPQVNDVLFSRVGSNLGHPVILKEELELCTFVSLGFLRSKGTVTSNYLKHWMRDEFFAKQVAEHVKGGGQPNLNTGWLKEFKIIVPDLEKQKEFDDFCDQVDKSKVAILKNYLQGGVLSYDN
ncbi:restriction endonuclease subunit S [Blautia sp.]